METQPPEEETPNPAVAVVVGVLVIGAMAAVGAIAVFGPGSGATLATLPIGPQPAEASFTVATAGSVQVWADLEVDTGDISHNESSSDLPHVMDYVVEVTPAGGKPQTLKCNPFNSNFARTSGDGYHGDIYWRAYDGLVRGCVFKVPAGTHKVRVHSEAVKADKRIRFKKNVMVLREE